MNLYPNGNSEINPFTIGNYYFIKDTTNFRYYSRTLRNFCLATDNTSFWVHTCSCPIRIAGQCGHCCKRWGACQKGILEDLLRWLKCDRQDILCHVIIWLEGGRRVSGSDIMKAYLPQLSASDSGRMPMGKSFVSVPSYANRRME